MTKLIKITLLFMLTALFTNPMHCMQDERKEAKEEKKEETRLAGAKAEEKEIQRIVSECFAKGCEECKKNGRLEYEAFVQKYCPTHSDKAQEKKMRDSFEALMKSTVFEQKRSASLSEDDLLTLRLCRSSGNWVPNAVRFDHQRIVDKIRVITEMCSDGTFAQAFVWR